MIRGFLEASRPIIQGLLIVPRLDVIGSVVFLVDTGADTTTTAPEDSARLGVEFGRDFTGQLFPTFGVGGRAFEHREVCELLLRHENGPLDRHVLIVAFAEPTDVNARLPSLLGRDVLALYRLTLELRRGVVTLE